MKTCLLVLLLVAAATFAPAQLQPIYGTYGSGAPGASTPCAKIGDHYVDISAGTLYVAATISLTRTSSSCTWQAGSGGGLGDPGSNGIVKRTALNTTTAATSTDVIALFSTCSGTQYLGADGACHNSSGGASSGTNTVQVGNGSGGFNSNNFVKEDTTNGFIGSRNDSAVPLFPMDVSWTSLSRSTGPNNLAEFVGSWTTTPASPADVHMVNLTLSTSGTDAAFSDGTFAGYYLTLNDNRTPSGASTVGHELGTVSRFGFNGGSNLTCTTCGAFYATADYGAASNGSTIAAYIADGGSIHGTGILNQWEAFSGGTPIISGGGVNNFTIFAANLAGTVGHGTGSGCVAAFAAGSGVCSGAGNQFAFFSDAAFPSALLNTLAVGQQTACVTIFCVNGGVQIGSTGGAQSDITLTSKNNGSVAVTLKMPLAGSGINLKWPGDSATFVGTTNSYDNTAVTGNLVSQTLFSAPDSTARHFRVSVYAACSASVTTSTLVLNVNYTDDVQAQTQSSSSISCASSGTKGSLIADFFSAGGNNVTISTTTTNSPQYKIHAIIEESNPSNNST